MVDAVLAESANQVHGEERQPTHDEAAHNYAQGLGSLGLHPEPLYLCLDISFAHFGDEPWLTGRVALVEGWRRRQIPVLQQLLTGSNSQSAVRAAPVGSETGPRHSEVAVAVDTRRGVAVPVRVVDSVEGGRWRGRGEAGLLGAVRARGRGGRRPSVVTDGVAAWVTDADLDWLVAASR